MFMQSIRRQKFVLLALVCGLVGGMWGHGEAYEVIQVQNGGVISGTVKFVGSVPPPEQLEITKNRAICGEGPRPSEALMVSGDGRIQNAVVSLADIVKGKQQPALEENPKLVQEKCWFGPHVLLVPAGSTIDLFNRDKAMHNIHTTSKINPVVNKAHPSFRKRLRFKLRKPEVVKVKCDIHPWMSAWFVVTEHPYYTLTGANGSFTLTDVPPGTYTLQVWHETLGKQTQQVRVSDNKETKVVFELKP